MKKKLKIPTTNLIQALELTKLERDKYLLIDELSNCKAKFLKFVDERKEWEKGKSLMVEDVKVLKEK